jgi:hypothetical protein
MNKVKFRVDFVFENLFSVYYPYLLLLIVSFEIYETNLAIVIFSCAITTC